MPTKKPFCLMPWIHFHVGDDGAVNACCVANINYGNINSNSLEEIWNGSPVKALRKKFEDGVSDKRCGHCINTEKGGATSIRQETFKKYPEIDITKNMHPIYFDIRFSNVCNLKCRTCWHGASSSWFEDAKKLKTNKGHKAVIKNIDDFNSFIEKMGPALLKAKELYFAGGEPLVTEEHYLLLQWLVDNNATQMQLRYNTNLTILKYKGISILELWKKFPNIEILASVDASRKLAGYVRSNSEWMDIERNMSLLKKLANVDLKIAPTISILNTEYLIELVEDCVTNEFITYHDIYINILERPNHYNIQAFPAEKKNQIEQELNLYKLDKPDAFQVQIQEIISYMKFKDQSKNWSRYVQHNQKLDELRNETHPYN